MPDKKILCRSCSNKFLFTDNEQREFKKKGWVEPKSCPLCRNERKKTTSAPETPVKQSVPKQATNEGFEQYNKTSGFETKYQQSLDNIPTNYLKKGYFDDEGILLREIFSKDARDMAALLNARNITPTKLRNFYNKLASIKYHLEQTNDFNITRVKLAGFLTNVVYDKGRKAVPEEFLDFIKHNMPSAELNSKCFLAFVEHYKSVLAYTKTEKGFIASKWIGGDGLPQSYLDGGYYDDKGYLRKEVIIEWPMAIVDVFAKQDLSSTALRRFYNKAKGLNNKYQFNPNYRRILPELYAFERDAAYAASRLVVPGVFIGFVVKNIDLATNDEKGFKGFIEHFQSIVAFAKGKLKEGGYRQ